ncbi:MAG: purine-nucleoside phosphorylase, partial [Beduini sp.]
PVTSGIYCFFQGPMFETPAEIRMLRMLGVGMVGMSTVPEAIVARHSGMKTLGISLVTNKAAGLSQNQLSHEEVMEAANKAEKNMVALVSGIIEKIEI